MLPASMLLAYGYVRMKSTWILLLGCAAIVEFFLLIWLPDIAISAFAAVLLATVVAGFCLRGPESFVVGLPAMPVAGLQFMSGMTSATYPQAFLFRIELRNLYLLFAVTFYAIALVVVVLTGHRDFIFSFYAPISYGLVLGAAAGGLALLWVRERRLVRLRHVTLGNVRSASGSSGSLSFTYEFWDLHGDRRGNSVQLRPGLMSRPEPVTPVFFDPSDPDFNKAGFSFVFHRFVVVDSRHLPADSMGTPSDNQSA